METIPKGRLHRIGIQNENPLTIHRSYGFIAVVAAVIIYLFLQILRMYVLARSASMLGSGRAVRSQIIFAYFGPDLSDCGRLPRFSYGGGVWALGEQSALLGSWNSSAESGRSPLRTGTAEVLPGWLGGGPKRLAVRLPTASAMVGK